jgi:hypothetical protein
MVLAIFTLVVGAWAAQPDAQLARFKTGEVSFTLLQSDGVTPVAETQIKMLSADDSAVVAETVSDKLGKAIVALTEGRYLLNVAGQTLSVVDVAGDASLSQCRVVIPAAALLVAGQEEAKEEEEERKRGAFWLRPVVIGGVVVLLAAGGYAIYENNDDDDDDDDDDGTLPPPPPPADDDDDDDDDDDRPRPPPPSPR